MIQIKVRNADKVNLQHFETAVLNYLRGLGISRAQVSVTRTKEGGA
ncbi:MAG: hypothetical protein HUK08_08075 [Bacteroidaceae bacterium]|nr:hypothetical protein [Bacteroidaceae bacterium]